MNEQSSTRRRRRFRSSAEQMWWDNATPVERLAFTLGYVAGQGITFPSPQQIEVLSVQLGVKPATPAEPTIEPITTKFRHQGTGYRRRPDGRRFTYDLEEVARIARAAIAAGRSAAEAVFEQIPECASYKAASIQIARARKAGHDIPYVYTRSSS